MTLEEKAAAWDRIREAWETYCREGATRGGFDWDFDSRDLMIELTGTKVTYWYPAP